MSGFILSGASYLLTIPWHFNGKKSNEPKLGNHKSYHKFMKYSVSHASFSILALSITGKSFHK